MRSVVVSLILTIRASLRDRAALQLEILALRHQLHVPIPAAATAAYASRSQTVGLPVEGLETMAAAVVIVKPRWS